MPTRSGSWQLPLARNSTKLAYTLIAPALIGVCLIVFYPIARAFHLSFTNATLAGTSPPRFVGFANYTQLLTDNVFWRAFSNTAYWTLGIVIGEFILGFIIAMLLNMRFSLVGFFRATILLPWAMPATAAGLLWGWMYDEQYGLINHLLTSIGLIPHAYGWLSNPSIALFSVILTAIWRGTPFMAIMLLAGLHSIPSELYEVAKIDGAGRIQAFFRITVPMMRNIIVSATVLTTIWTFNSFDLTWVMTKGGPAHSTHLLSTYVYQLAFRFFNISYASAIGTIMLVILLVFAGIYLKVTSASQDFRI